MSRVVSQPPNVICFGEVMTRLTPSRANETLFSSDELRIDFAGAESNVASALARWGAETSLVTKFPDNPISDKAISHLSAYGINTKYVNRGGPRLGTYYIELGSSIRPSRVVYDRAGSSFSQVTKSEFDWPSILRNADCLHISGITSALSKQCAEENLEAAKRAQEMGVVVSFDLNFRRSLWSENHNAAELFIDILHHTDIVFGNQGVVKDVFGYDGNNSAQYIQQNFNIENVAFTQRKHIDASTNILSGELLTKDGAFFSEPRKIEIKDRFGTGDAFAAGILWGYLNGFSSQHTLDFATAAFALKHTIWGDQLTASKDEIQSIANGNVSGHVIR
ncbi:MAG: sugar kinase [Aliiglaciecola sp.]